MKKVEPRDLEVGKTYFATNLSTDRRASNLVRNKRYIVTVSGKKDAPSGPLFDRSKMPLDLYLTNIKEIQGKGEGKGWDEILVMMHEHPDWWNMTDITDVPKFYEKEVTPIGVSHVVESKEEKKKELKKSTDDILLNKPRDTLGQSKDKLARLRVPEDVSKFMGSFGGRKPKRKTHRRKRSKTRRRKRSKTHRRKRSKTRRKRKSRRKRRKSRSRRK